MPGFSSMMDVRERDRVLALPYAVLFVKIEIVLGQSDGWRGA
jgi:hypothetical protein